jgi:hypothetical protein
MTTDDLSSLRGDLEDLGVFETPKQTLRREAVAFEAQIPQGLPKSDIGRRKNHKVCAFYFWMQRRGHKVKLLKVDYIPSPFSSASVYVLQVWHRGKSLDFPRRSVFDSEGEEMEEVLSRGAIKSYAFYDHPEDMPQDLRARHLDGLNFRQWFGKDSQDFV